MPTAVEYKMAYLTASVHLDKDQIHISIRDIPEHQHQIMELSAGMNGVSIYLNQRQMDTLVAAIETWQQEKATNPAAYCKVELPNKS